MALVPETLAKEVNNSSAACCRQTIGLALPEDAAKLLQKAFAPAAKLYSKQNDHNHT